MGLGHDHQHSHGPTAVRAGARHRNRLTISFVLIAVFFVVEAVTAVLTNSLALLSDAGHMLTDVVGLGMALAAIQLADRHSRRAGSQHPGNQRSRTQRSGTQHSGSQHTFGLYRLEILAAFVNALLLLGVSVYVLVEAMRRIGGDPEIDTGPMLVVAILGLVVNLVAFFLLREGARESINVEGAYLEVLADTVGSVGVIAAAVLLELFGWTWVDPLVGFLIGAWILPRTIRLGGRAVRILLQSAPPGVDLVELRLDLEALPDVVEVHDLHVWTLTSEMENATAHLVIEPDADSHGVLDQARHLLQDRYQIEHATLQVEPSDHRGCDEVAW